MLDTLRILGSTIIIPNGAIIPLIIVVLITILAVSIFGNVGIDWKTKKFTFGRPSRRKRPCKDCIMLLLSKRTVFEAAYNNKKSNVLRDQMNYTEHKIQEIKYILEETFREDLKYFRKIEDNERENKEFSLYRELLSHSMFEAKDEVRRSFKENGFHTLTGTEFDAYTKERTFSLITIVRGYLLRNYPLGMIVPMPERFKRNEATSTMRSIEMAIRDIYNHAKDIRSKIESELNILQEKFAEEIEGFINFDN